MKFTVKETKYTPPKQGFHRHVIEVEGGPEWLEGRRRKVLHRITRVTAIVFDDGATEYSAWEQRIRQDGTPYDEAPRKVWRPSATGYSEAQQRAHDVLSAIKRDKVQTQL